MNLANNDTQLSNCKISYSVLPIASGPLCGDDETLTPPVVTFGGIPATTVELIPDGSGGTTLQATAPPHEAGTVDVVVTFDGESPIILPVAYTYTASEEPGDEPTEPTEPTPDLPSDPSTPPSSDVESSDDLAETGANNLVILLAAISVVASGLIIYRRNG